MVILTSSSPEETFALGESYASSVSVGLVIGLIGDLGAGKTQWVRGFAKGLGVTERVHSPTFTLVNEYRTGRLPCYHLDLYRLESIEQILHAGLEEYLFPGDAVTVIEWFDRIHGKLAVGDNLRIIHIGSTSESERTIGYEDPRT